MQTLKFTKREFLLRPNECLKQLTNNNEIVVTNRGEEEFRVRKACNVVTDEVNENREINLETYGTYGCGCKRNSKALCDKHGRY